MKKTFFALIAAGTLALAVTACTHESNAANLPPGEYEKTTRSTDAHGTTTVRKSYTDVEVDEYGNKRAVVETKTTKDPRGLFNKRTTSQTKQVIKESDY